MSKSLDELADAARMLPWESRVYLADLLLASLDGTDEVKIERARIEEAKRRVAEVQAGMEQGATVEEVYRQIRARLRS